MKCLNNKLIICCMFVAIGIGLLLFCLGAGLKHNTNNCTNTMEEYKNPCVITTVHTEYWYQELGLIDYLTWYIVFCIAATAIIVGLNCILKILNE